MFWICSLNRVVICACVNVPTLIMFKPQSSTGYQVNQFMQIILDS